MARAKLKFTWIVNHRARKAAYKKRMQGLIKKAEELTILCNMTACLIFFSRDEKKLVAWPSHEVAKSLTDRFFSLPDLQRNMKAVDQESFIKTNTKKIAKKLADSRKVIEGFEMDHLMFQLQNGRRLVDLSQTQIEKLISYSSKKIMGLRRELGFSGQPYPSLNEPFLGDDENPRASDVAPGLGGNSDSQIGSGAIYLMDQWFFDDPKVQKHGDETRLPTTAPRFNLNFEPSDDDEDMEMVIYKGESSKSGGAEDA